MLRKLRLYLYQVVIDNAVNYALKHDDDELLCAVGRAANELHYMRTNPKEELHDGTNHHPKLDYMKHDCLNACCN